MFDKNNAAILNAYILNGTITANSANRIFYLKVKPNTTYAITKYKSYYFTVGCVNKIPEIGDTLTNIQSGPDNYRYDGSKGSLIYTTDATAQYIVCRFYQTSLDTGVSLNDMLGSIQVEVNSTATDYVEHKQQTFTFPLGNEKLMLGDYLADDGIHHVRGQVTESGTTITLNDAKSGGVYLCNKKTEGNLVGKTLTFDTAVTDALIEYELQEEVIIPYTSAQQEVYNQIKNAYSYDEVTIITGSSDGNKPFFTVQTYKDLNKELNNKVDKVQGKELSSNDFTDTLKEKLEGLENYDDTEIKADISDIQEEQVEQNTDIENLQEENARLKATLPTTTGEGQDITLDKTAEMEFVNPPLPRGNTKQDTTTGKNLLEPNGTPTTIRGVSWSYREDGAVVGTRVSSNENVSDFTLISSVTFQPGSYIYSCFDNESTPGASKYQFNISINGASYWGTGNYSFVLNEVSTIRVVLRVYPNFTGTAIFKPMIRLSSIQESNYEPYTGGIPSPNPDYPQEITNVTGDVEVKVQNKNIVKIDNVEQTTINGLTYSIQNGILTINGTANNGTSIILANNISLKQGTYTHSINDIKSGMYFSYDNINNTMLRVLSGTKEKSKTFQLAENTIYNRYILWIDNGTSFNNEKFYLQTEKNSTATEWNTHQEQVLPLTLGNIELCKIGDYQDYFYKESNKWYLHKEISKVVLDGSQRIYLVGTYDNTCRFDYEGLTNGLPINENKAICSRFTMNYGDTADYEHARTLNTSYPNTIVFYISKSKATTENEFNAWLSNNNTTVYYILNTATNTEITDTTLISQLEAINNAISYEEQTNILSNTIALFSVEAYQSTKLILENLDSRLTLVEG